MSPVQSMTKKKVEGAMAFADREKTFRMPLFRPGTVVMGQSRYTVSYVMVRRGSCGCTLRVKMYPCARTAAGGAHDFSTVRQPETPVVVAPRRWRRYSGGALRIRPTATPSMAKVSSWATTIGG